MSASDTILAARVEDRRFADVLFDEDRRRHDRRALDHYRHQLARAAREHGAS